MNATALRPRVVAVLLALLLLGCGGPAPGVKVVTFPASAVGAEAKVLRQQIARFEKLHPDIQVETRRTPDAADQRHQLYVQWLNAHASDPDVLQLDVIWVPEFAAAGWVLPLDGRGIDQQAFFPGTIRACRWRGRLFAVPWFVDVGMLYWRTDLLPGPPSSLAELARTAKAVKERAGLRSGFVWQGARYEGLICVFNEVLGGFGGRILDDDGRVVVDSPAGVKALTWLSDLIRDGASPESVLAWKEEQTRFAFENGEAVYLRNWPYAWPLFSHDEDSKVRGKFAVAPMPAGPGGSPTATLGSSELAVNARSDVPGAAVELVKFLTRPEQMVERAKVTGQYPPRAALYDDPRLAGAFGAPAADVRRIVTHATPRPVTPVYTELSEILQIALHRALTGQQAPRVALADAAKRMRALLDRLGLSPGKGGGRAR